MAHLVEEQVSNGATLMWRGTSNYSGMSLDQKTYIGWRGGASHSRYCMLVLYVGCEDPLG